MEKIDSFTPVRSSWRSRLIGAACESVKHAPQATLEIYVETIILWSARATLAGSRG